MAIEMKKTGAFMNKPLYISQAVLDISKTLMYEFILWLFSTSIC